jgi:hypothetical protein
MAVKEKTLKHKLTSAIIDAAVFVLIIFITVVVCPLVVYLYIRNNALYKYNFMISQDDCNNAELKKWATDNIGSFFFVVSTIRTDPLDPHSVIGWRYRFLRKTDLVAFKLRWI